MTHAPHDRYATWVICLIAGLSTMGLGLIMPVMPALLGDFGITEVTRAAAIGGALSLVFAVMQFLFSPLLGALSDLFGRRPVLLGSLVLSAVDYLLMALAPVLWLVFVGRMVSGISSATFSVASAYLADRSTGSDRAGAFGVLGAAAGIGFVLGPFVGGLLGTFGPRAPFLVAAALSVLAFLLARAVLPESLPETQRRPIAMRDVNPLAPLLGGLGLPAVLLAAVFLDAIAGFAIPAVWAYFGALRFGWDAGMIGVSFGLMGLAYAAAQALLVRPLVARLGNIGAAWVALAAGGAGFLALALGPSAALALVILPVFALHSLARTGLTAQLSQIAPSDVQGRVQCTLASLSALASLIAFPLMTQSFALGPALPFALAAGLVAAALVCVLAWGRGPQPVVS